MKKFILLSICFITLSVSAQTVKYKDIYSLIKVGNTVEAFPKLLTYLQTEPKHPNANYWVAKIYYDKAKTNNSTQQADSSIFFFKRAIENITVLDVNIINAGRFPDFTGTDATLVLEYGKKWMQAKIDEMEALKKQIQLNKSKEEVSILTKNTALSSSANVSNPTNNQKQNVNTPYTGSKKTQEYQTAYAKATADSIYYAKEGRKVSVDSICNFNMSRMAGKTQAKKISQAENDSIFMLDKKLQDKFQMQNKCPNCQSTVVTQYFNFIKSGELSNANALVYYNDCKEDCEMPMFKGTYEELKANSDKVKSGFAKYNLNKEPSILYIDKNTCLIFNYIITSATLHPISATKVNGIWKLNVSNKQLENEYFEKLTKTLSMHPSSYLELLDKSTKQVK
ncbi:MAG: hypothetical protein A3F72_17780 [Bacteroidetes bacterium RIFCSPLOWO2_12_FULL_35_15]|nr:MAG: hypothetical protein A3F72_17780 [Bacteroidetes bacterium RIFCSPLOWO2_12_FULL_35_15]